MSYKEGLKFSPAPDFERFRKALTGGEPDRVPACECVIDLPIKEAFLGKPIKTLEDDIEFWYRAGYDYYITYMNGHVAPDRRKDKKFIEKYGISKTAGWASGGSWITDWDEYRDYPWESVDEIDYSAVENSADLLPEGMKLIVNLGPLFSGVWRTMGITGFSYALVENIELVEAIAERIAKTLEIIAEKVIPYPHVQGIWMGDDLAFAEGLVVPPDFYRKYIFPWYKKIGDLCRSHNKLYIHHSDGKLDDVMEDLIECGFHALQPFEPKAMDVYHIKAKYGDRVAIIGNVDIGETLSLGTPRKVRMETMEKLRRLAPGGRYALGSSNSITHYVRIENYYTMLNTLFKYGKYPINIPEEACCESDK